MKEYGQVWEEKLKELIESDLSLREMARRLQADPATIKKYAKKLMLNTADNYGEKDNYNEETLKEKRKIWLKLMQENINKSKIELREMDKFLYTWLYRNDRHWLNENSPI